MKVFRRQSSVFGPLSVPRRSRGFTLLEVTIVAGLTSFFSLLIASSWFAWGRSLADSHARCTVAQEANLAIETLQRDLSGYRLDQEVGSKNENRLVGTLITGGSQLRLCYDGAPTNGIADWATPDAVCLFDIQGDQLIRTNQNTGNSFVVASHVSQMQLTDLGDGIRIELSFDYRDITKTFTIITRNP